MKVVIFGTSGMVGQGVLRECLSDPGIERIVSVERGAGGPESPKLRRLAHQDFFNFSAIEKDLAGFDACFFVLGATSVGQTEEAYSRVNYDIPLAAGRTLARLNPAMTFLYISGMGTDSSERGRSMWARVKGRTENALLKLPFKAAYMFRPGLIVPMHGIRSKTAWYNLFYTGAFPILWLSYQLAPTYVTTTERIGLAMIEAARNGAPHPILETSDIHVLYQRSLGSVVL